MTNSISIGIIGDFNPEKPSHIATNDALKHAADLLSLDVKPEWLGTGNLRRKSVKDTIGQHQGLFAAPGTPYFFVDGAVKGIKLAREMNIPFLGTCGGSQYALLEFARNVAGMTNAAHTELAPQTDMPLLIKIACKVDKSKGPKVPRMLGTFEINLVPETEASKIYGRPKISESYNCSYELNPEYEGRLVEAGLIISGRDDDGKARIFEVHNKRFFIATGFLPQLNSTPENPHPLILAFLKSASENSTSVLFESQRNT
jgi:CTP synthase (UTP-ammonia lyase)